MVSFQQHLKQNVCLISENVTVPMHDTSRSLPYYINRFATVVTLFVAEGGPPTDQPKLLVTLGAFATRAEIQLVSFRLGPKAYFFTPVGSISFSISPPIPW